MTSAEIEKVRKEWEREEARKRLDAQRDRNTLIQECFWYSTLILVPLIAWAIVAATNEEPTWGFGILTIFPIGLALIGIREAIKERRRK